MMISCRMDLPQSHHADSSSRWRVSSQAGSCAPASLIPVHPSLSIRQSTPPCPSARQSLPARSWARSRTMIKNRGESLDDRPNFETSNSALELKCTDSAPTVSSAKNRSEKLTADARRISEHLALRRRSSHIEIVAHELAHTQQTETSAFLPASVHLVSVVPLPSVDQALLLVLPEPLDLRRRLVLPPHVRSPRPLDTRCHGVPVSIPLALEVEQLSSVLVKISSMRALTVSGFLMNALVTPICHSSLEIFASVKIRSQPDRSSPSQM